MKCRVGGCGRQVERNQPGESERLCFRCWEEIDALLKARKRKNEARRCDS